MPFRFYCDVDKDSDGKKCRKEMEPVIEKDTGIIYCECGIPLQNQKLITEFAKRQMLALGQIKRTERKKQAFSVKCASCEKEAAPNLNKKGALVCSYCDEELKNLAAPFAHMLKQNLKIMK